MTTHVHICISCGSGEDRPGVALHQALEGKLDAKLHTVECMAVCKRPCTVAVSGPGKWTYVVGDMGTQHLGALCDYVRLYTASEHGTPPLKERPTAIRAGTIARIPPKELYEDA